MTLQQIINSRLGILFALAVGRMTPPGVGYALARFLADRMSRRRQAAMVQAVRANQWVVRGGRLTGEALDQAVRAVFRQVGRCLYDQYHTLGNPRAILSRVTFSPEFEASFERIRDGRSGTLFVIPHLSNFDLVGQALAVRGLRFQVLSLPEPPGGHRLQNRLRSQGGIEVTPMSFSALRRALENLRAGGTVLTGIDRPEAPSPERPVFFGRPSALPTGYVRLALKAGVPVTPLGVQTQPGGTYCLQAAEPIPMRPQDDPQREAVSNAEAVLHILEKWIAQTPDQWAMFYPVWPEALHEIS